MAGGYSQYQGRGVWRDAGGRVYREPHARLDVSTRNGRGVLQAFRRYGRKAKEKVLFAVVNGRARFIRP